MMNLTIDFGFKTALKQQEDKNRTSPKNQGFYGENGLNLEHFQEQSVASAMNLFCLRSQTNSMFSQSGNVEGSQGN